MKIHIIDTPFFSRECQFEEGKKSLCVGIEVSALKSYGEYRVYIGSNRETYYDISYKEALALYQIHGENAIWKKGKKQVFILPIKAFRQGKKEHDQSDKTQENSELDKNDTQLNLF